MPCVEGLNSVTRTAGLNSGAIAANNFSGCFKFDEYTFQETVLIHGYQVIITPDTGSATLAAGEWWMPIIAIDSGVAVQANGFTTPAVRLPMVNTVGQGNMVYKNTTQTDAQKFQTDSPPVFFPYGQGMKCNFNEVASLYVTMNASAGTLTFYVTWTLWWFKWPTS